MDSKAVLTSPRVQCFVRQDQGGGAIRCTGRLVGYRHSTATQKTGMRSPAIWRLRLPLRHLLLYRLPGHAGRRADQSRHPGGRSQERREIWWVSGGKASSELASRTVTGSRRGGAPRPLLRPFWVTPSF